MLRRSLQAIPTIVQGRAMRTPRLALIMTLTAISGGALFVAQSGAQVATSLSGSFQSADAAREALQRARNEAAEADQRGTRLEREARAATIAAERTAREAAALAARIQQAEAGIAAAEARTSLIEGERRALQTRLAERQGPLIRLTAALQRLARRPVALSALRPGSLRETVYLRALLETTIPEVRRRTSALRTEIERGRQLENEARQALTVLREGEETLGQRRQQLAAIETRQRLESRRRSGDADREAERALALAEEARDLDTLVSRLDKAGGLRKELAALPGPVMRPSNPQISRVADTAAPSSSPTGAPQQYQLPVDGRTLAGFGSVPEGGVRTRGITLAPRAGAQVIAPAAGRVAFAGPYRGYERIAIIEHGSGWTSLVTGMARIDVNVGDELVDGAPLGIAAVDRPSVTLELRRAGTPVNPLDYVR